MYRGLLVDYTKDPRDTKSPDPDLQPHGIIYTTSMAVPKRIPLWNKTIRATGLQQLKKGPNKVSNNWMKK